MEIIKKEQELNNIKDIKTEILRKIDRYNSYKRGGKKIVVGLRVNRISIPLTEDFIQIDFSVGYDKDGRGQEYFIIKHKKIRLKLKTEKQEKEIIDFIKGVTKNYTTYNKDKFKIKRPTKLNQ